MANNNIGQAITLPLIESGEIIDISNNIIKPYYFKKMEATLSQVKISFGESIPYRIHQGEGAFFLWFWFPNLPITTKKLYQRLKKRNVLIVPGEYFFFGIKSPWEIGRAHV